MPAVGWGLKQGTVQGALRGGGGFALFQQLAEPIFWQAGQDASSSSLVVANCSWVGRLVALHLCPSLHAALAVSGRLVGAWDGACDVGHFGHFGCVGGPVSPTKADSREEGHSACGTM